MQFCYKNAQVCTSIIYSFQNGKRDEPHATITDGTMACFPRANWTTSKTIFSVCANCFARRKKLWFSSVKNKCVSWTPNPLCLFRVIYFFTDFKYLMWLRKNVSFIFFVFGVVYFLLISNIRSDCKKILLFYFSVIRLPWN